MTHSNHGRGSSIHRLVQQFTVLKTSRFVRTCALIRLLVCYNALIILFVIITFILKLVYEYFTQFIYDNCLNIRFVV